MGFFRHPNPNGINGAMKPKGLNGANGTKGLKQPNGTKGVAVIKRCTFHQFLPLLPLFPSAPDISPSKCRCNPLRVPHSTRSRNPKIRNTPSSNSASNLRLCSASLIVPTYPFDRQALSKFSPWGKDALTSRNLPATLLLFYKLANCDSRMGFVIVCWSSLRCRLIWRRFNWRRRGFARCGFRGHARIACCRIGRSSCVSCGCVGGRLRVS